MMIDRWSLTFLKCAENGETEYMLAVAEMYLRKGGWGKIAYNQSEGERWIRRALAFNIEGAKRFQTIIDERKRALAPGEPLFFEPPESDDDFDDAPLEYAPSKVSISSSPISSSVLQTSSSQSASSNIIETPASVQTSNIPPSVEEVQQLFARLSTIVNGSA